VGGGYNGRMALLGAQFVLALEPSAVAGALVSRGLGSARVRSVARVPLSPGALEVSAFEPNLRRPDEVKAALVHLASTLGAGNSAACVVLPDGLARLGLLDVPKDATPERYARFRLMGSLPYPAEEALVDVLPLGGSRVLAAAVRRAVVHAYEAVVRAAGIEQDRVDLAPLAALAGLRRAAPPAPPMTVDVVLGEVAVSLAARDGALLAAFRNRRRDGGPGEGERLRLEVERTALLAGDGAAPPRVRVLGPGAAALVREWRAAGRAAELGWSVPAPDLVETAEMAWLGAALS
jgi:hypothetical protein